MTATRHLRLIPTEADVIPLQPKGRVEYTPQRRHTLTTVASCAVTRRGDAVTVDGKPAGPGIRAGLADTDRAGLTAWARQGNGDHVATLTQDGISALSLWTGPRTSGPRGGDAA